MARHGADRYVTDDEHRVMILLAYHDSTCPDTTECVVRERHASELSSNYPLLKRFLQRLSELELEDALDAV